MRKKKDLSDDVDIQRRNDLWGLLSLETFILSLLLDINSYQKFFKIKALMYVNVTVKCWFVGLSYV